MKKFLLALITLFSFCIDAQAFLVEDGHFVIVIPDQLKNKKVTDKGWIEYTNSFENQTVAYLTTDLNPSVTPNQLLEKLGGKYMQKQSNPSRGRICGENDGIFYVMLYNPGNPTNVCIIIFTYDDNLPYSNMLRKFNEDVSCSHYIE